MEYVINRPKRNVLITPTLQRDLELSLLSALSKFNKSRDGYDPLSDFYSVLFQTVHNFRFEPPNQSV